MFGIKEKKETEHLASNLSTTLGILANTPSMSLVKVHQEIRNRYEMNKLQVFLPLSFPPLVTMRENKGLIKKAVFSVFYSSNLGR